jgi:hypothetical protein
MIRTALEFIRKELEIFMVARENDSNYSPGNVVDLKGVASPEGKINFSDTMHITVMLAGVEEERRIGKVPVRVPVENNQWTYLNAPVELNLNVLFVASNSNYETALRDLSDVILFFQSNPVFDAAGYPALNAGASDPANKPWQLVDKIIFQMSSLSFEQLNNLWSMIGLKYLPSIVYRMKMLTVFDTQAKSKAPSITEMNISD